MAFKPGESGNPGGRPKGTKSIRNLILESTKDGKELVTLMLSCARGKMREAKAGDRIKAIEWLGNYAFGRPIQPVEHPVDDGDQTLEQMIADSWKKAEPPAKPKKGKA